MTNDVTEVRARMQQLHIVQQTQDRAVGLLALSACTTDEHQAADLQQASMQVKQHADALAEAYYQQYPNCMSRNIHPWAK